MNLVLQSNNIKDLIPNLFYLNRIYFLNDKNPLYNNKLSSMYKSWNGVKQFLKELQSLLQNSLIFVNLLEVAN